MNLAILSTLLLLAPAIVPKIAPMAKPTTRNIGPLISWS